MKKILNILAAIALSITVMSTVDARKVIPKLPVTRQMASDTKNLQAKLADVEKAKTPEKKEAAQKSAYDAAQQLLVDLKEERSFMGDIYSGYSLAQIKKARAQLEKLYPMQKRVNETIQKKKIDLAKITVEGWLWNTATPGKEKEHEVLSLELTKLKNVLARVDRAIRNQKVIAGEEWSNAYRTLLASGVIGTTALGIDFLLYGGAGTSAAAAKAAVLAKTSSAWIGEKATTAWNWLPSLRSVEMPKIEISDNVANIDGKEIAKTSITSKFGSTLAEGVWGTLGMAKDMAIQMAVSGAVSASLAFAMKRLNALLEDPTTTPEQLEAQNAKVKNIMRQESAKMKK